MTGHRENTSQKSRFNTAQNRVENIARVFCGGKAHTEENGIEYAVKGCVIGFKVVYKQAQNPKLYKLFGQRGGYKGLVKSP